MNSLTAIKQGVANLFKMHPHIHINVSRNHPKVHLTNHPVTITGVYPNIFQLEDRSGDRPATYIVQYVELMMGQVEIIELMQQQAQP